MRWQHWLYTIPMRLRSLFRHDAVERELNDELQYHLEQKIQDGVSNGLSPAEARHAALRAMEGLELQKELCRDARRVRVLENLLQDFRFGLRMIGKNRSFSAIVVLTLALGIGANTAIFSVVNAVLLRPLPFAAPEQLVRVDSTVGKTNEVGGVSYLDFIDWRSQNTAFKNMAVFHSRGFALARPGLAIRVQGAMVSADLFPLLGVAPVAGRWFLPNEDKPGAANGANAVMLSHRLWQEQFGSDPEVIGKTVELDHDNFVVVGVMPPAFQLPIAADPVDLWTTVAVDERPADGDKSMLRQRGVHYLSVIARLNPGVTPAAAAAQMGTIVDSLNKQYPKDGLRGIRISPERDRLADTIRPALLVLLGSVGCVLLIACANLASLLLSRASVRQKEIAIRAALGAGRARILQQLLIESLTLSLLGGVLALFIAGWGIRILLRLAPQNVPRLAQTSVDGYVLLFTVALAMVTAIVLGLTPALQLSKLNLIGAVKESGAAQSTGTRQSRTRSILVVSQMALAVVLLAGAGLLIQSLARLLRVDPGFAPDHILSFRADVPDNYPAQRQQDYYQQLVARLRVSPGVRSASAVFGLPFSGTQLRVSYGIEGRQIPESDQPYAIFNIAEPDYFRTLGIALLRGRDFDAHDDLSSAPVVIINEVMAREIFGSDDPVGKRIKPGVGNGYKEPPMRTIVAVIRNTQSDSLGSPASPELFIPLAQCPRIGSMTFVLRTQMDPLAAVAAAQAQASTLDKSVPLFSVKTLDQYLSASVAQPRFNVLLLGVFAGLALVIAAIGLYGAISYSVTQRTHEIGIRLALGAQRNDILRIIVAPGAALACLGIAIGLIAALAVTRLITSLLFGVSARDPLTFAGVTALLVFVALLASLLPALRAMRVDPLRALRYE